MTQKWLITTTKKDQPNRPYFVVLLSDDIEEVRSHIISTDDSNSTVVPLEKIANYLLIDLPQQSHG